MKKAKLKYKIPPKRDFRRMGLGAETNGYIRVVAGFRFDWWSPWPIQPIIVKARIIRRKVAAA
jgi:hypothetical protein